MSEFALRFATDELERAQREAEHARLAWKIARAARPGMVDIETMEAYCEAADYAAEAQGAYERALVEGQAEWLATQRDRGAEARGFALPPDLEASLAERPSPVDSGQVRRLGFITKEIERLNEALRRPSRED